MNTDGSDIDPLVRSVQRTLVPDAPVLRDDGYPHAISTSATSVWHYTSAQGLLGILSDHGVWATSSSVLNDLSEFEYGIRIFRDTWMRLRETLTHRDDLISFAHSMFDVPALISAARGFYIVSASRQADSLNQWQGYSHGDGYAIQLTTDVRLAPIAPDSFTVTSGFLAGAWFDVVYDPAQQAAIARDVILHTLESDFPDTPEGLAMSGLFFSKIASTAIRFKDPSFSDEREVRFIQPLYPELKPQFRPAGSLIVPYVRLARSENDLARESDRRALPVASVLVGPGDQHRRQLMARTARELMLWHGYFPEVAESAIPFLPR